MPPILRPFLNMLFSLIQKFALLGLTLLCGLLADWMPCAIFGKLSEPNLKSGRPAGPQSSFSAHNKTLHIWNPVHLDRIGQNHTYQYVPVRTSVYRNMSVQDCVMSTYWYVLVRTWNKTRRYLRHPGSALRVKYNSVQLLCKRYDRMTSNFKKCKVQVM
jgi:hypothetical protein